jgi:hypothetical protein
VPAMRTAVPALVALVLLVPATPALADQAIAELGREAPVAAYGGWAAWSRFDDATGRYALVLRQPGGAASAARLPSSSRPWDVSLGPDADGNVVAVYRRCGAKGCDVRRYNTASGNDVRLSAVSSPDYDEATPAIWRSTVVFTRRIGGCDVPFVKTLRSSTPSRRLLRAKCLETDPGHASIRGSRILVSSVDFSGADSSGAGIKVAEVRAYSSRTPGSTVLLRQTFGEESNLFGQVAQDARFAYTVRYGVHPTNTLVRVPLAGGARQEATAFRTLTSAFAKPSANSSLYVEHQGGEEAGCDGFTAVPCRVVYAPSSPWLLRRTLTPQLSVAYAGQPRAGQPLSFGGALAQQVVSRDRVVSRTPLAGVTVELYHRTGDSPERFEPTGLRAVTDAAGRYAIVLPAVGADPWYTAVASTAGVSTWAGRGTVGSVAP